MSQARKRLGFKGVFAVTRGLVLGLICSTFTVTASAQAASLTHDLAPASSARETCCILISPVMFQIRLEQTTNHYLGARLTNNALHVRTTIVGWHGIHMWSHGHYVAAWRSRFRSVHINRYGQPYGVRVYFTPSPSGPINVVRVYPNGSRIAEAGSGNWFNPVSWGWDSINHFITTHIVNPTANVARRCSDGMLDGAVAFATTATAAKLLAADGAIETAYYTAAASPDAMAVGILGGCMWGIYKN